MKRIQSKAASFLGILVIAAAVLNLSAFADESILTVAVSEGQEALCQEAVLKLHEEYPDIKVETVLIPDIDNQENEENQEARNRMEQLRVEIMAGSGPDVFLLTGDNDLFPDVVKNCYGGVFYDMEELLADTVAGEGFLPEVMDAGVIYGGRYLIPLGMTVSGVLTSEEQLGDFRPDSQEPVTFLKEIMEAGGWEGYGSAFMLGTHLGGIFKEPLLDYEMQEINLEEEMEELLEYAVAIHDGSSEDAYITDFGSEKGFDGESLIGGILQKGETPLFLPLPNGEEGCNAEITWYGAVRANSRYTEEAASLLEILLSGDFQQMKPERKGNISSVLPVNTSILREDLRQKISHILIGEEYGEAVEEAAEMLADALSGITSARFASYENKLLEEQVFFGVEYYGETLEEAIEALLEEQRFYFSE